LKNRLGKLEEIGDLIDLIMLLHISNLLEIISNILEYVKKIVIATSKIFRIPKVCMALKLMIVKTSKA
jgi:hypothetical protein